jgi:hypothetical protein
VIRDDGLERSQMQTHSLLCCATTAKDTQRADLGIGFAVGRQRTQSGRRRVLGVRRNDHSTPVVLVRVAIRVRVLGFELYMFLATATTPASGQFVVRQWLEQGYATSTHLADLGRNPPVLQDMRSTAVPGGFGLGLDNQSYVGHHLAIFLGTGINGEAWSLFEFELSTTSRQSRFTAHVHVDWRLRAIHTDRRVVCVDC